LCFVLIPFTGLYTFIGGSGVLVTDYFSCAEDDMIIAWLWGGEGRRMQAFADH